jgi:membrane-bound lytic murein transglycosylase D
MTKAYSFKSKATFLIVFGCLLLSVASQAQNVAPPGDTTKHIQLNDTVNQVQNFITDITDSASDLTSSNSALLYPDYADSVYLKRLLALNSSIPLCYNDQVASYIHLYCFRKRDQVERMLGVSQVYFPIFEKVLRDNNLPTELKYMAVIESALHPEAISRAGAVGMWQFMYGTAKVYGLKVNKDIDERRDIYKSSEAAAAYLKSSYDKYGDWLLAIASYNCGPGNIDKAIWRSGGKTNFWEILRYLPKETRSYVSAFIGAMYVMNYYPCHNLNPQYPDYRFCEISCVPVTHKLCLEKIAQYSNCSVDDIKFLNPGLNSNVIPAWDDDPYLLKLPSGLMPMYDSMKDSMVLSSIDIEPQYWYNFTRGGGGNVHVVRRGENIYTIATKYHVSATSIKRWNHLHSLAVRPGQRLKLDSGVRAYASSKSHKKSKGSKYNAVSKYNSNKVVYYKVRSGDTLYSIARRYKGITVSDIKASNAPVKTNGLKRGTTLKIVLRA